MEDYKKLVDLWDVQNLEKTNELERLRAENEHQRKGIEERERLIEDQKVQQDNLESSLNTSQLAKNELQSQLDGLQKEYTDVKLALEQYLEEQDAQQIGDQGMIAQEMADLEAAMIRLQLENKRMTEEYSRQREEEDSRQKAEPQLVPVEQDAFYALAQDNADKEAELVRLSLENTKLAEQYHQATTQLEESTALIQEFSETYNELDADRLQGLAQELADKEAELIRYSLEKDQWKKEAEQRAQQMVDIDQEKTDMSGLGLMAQELADKEAEVIRLSMERNRLEELSRQQTTQLEESTALIQEFSETYSELDADRLQGLAQELADREAELIRYSLEKDQWKKEAETACPADG